MRRRDNRPFTSYLLLGCWLLAAAAPRMLPAQPRALDGRTRPEAVLRTYTSRQERPPYRGVRVRRDIAYGPRAGEVLDLFMPASAPVSKATVLPLFVFAGPDATARRLAGGRVLYDNVALWAARHGMLGAVMHRRDDAKGPGQSGPEDFAALLAWLQAHAGSEGGDPGRVIAIGAGLGGTQLLNYLTHREFWCCRGPGIAALALIGESVDLSALPAQGKPPL
jgi:hypothetical protein